MGGDINSTYDNETNFEEFARIEINGIWYIISDSDSWGIHWKFKKEIVTEASWNLDMNNDGDMNDNITEQFINRDTDGDGNISGFITRWADNGSVTSN